MPEKRLQDMKLGDIIKSAKEKLADSNTKHYEPDLSGRPQPINWKGGGPETNSVNAFINAAGTGYKDIRTNGMFNAKTDTSNYSKVAKLGYGMGGGTGALANTGEGVYDFSRGVVNGLQPLWKDTDSSYDTDPLRQNSPINSPENAAHAIGTGVGAVGSAIAKPFTWVAGKAYNGAKNLIFGDSNNSAKKESVDVDEIVNRTKKLNTIQDKPIKSTKPSLENAVQSNGMTKLIDANKKIRSGYEQGQRDDRISGIYTNQPDRSTELKYAQNKLSNTNSTIQYPISKGAANDSQIKVEGGATRGMNSNLSSTDYATAAAKQNVKQQASKSFIQTPENNRQLRAEQLERLNKEKMQHEFDIQNAADKTAALVNKVQKNVNKLNPQQVTSNSKTDLKIANADIKPTERSLSVKSNKPIKLSPEDMDPRKVAENIYRTRAGRMRMPSSSSLPVQPMTYGEYEQKAGAVDNTVKLPEWMQRLQTKYDQKNETRSTETQPKSTELQKQAEISKASTPAPTTNSDSGKITKADLDPWKSLKDYFKGGSNSQFSKFMSSTAGHVTIAGLVGAGLLGAYYLYRKHKKNGQVTNNDVKNAAKLEVMQSKLQDQLQQS